MNVQLYLKRRQRIVDRALEQYLKSSPRYPKKLYEAMRYSVFSGGKRFRPILTLAVGELFGARRNVLLPFACAIELVHNYSLIHDDLPALDNDETRRGQPSTHKLFGDGIALLAGDALLTEAFALMARRRAAGGVQPDLVLQLIHEVARASGVGGMVGGQSIDLEAEGLPTGANAVERIHRFKTGALILAAARVGARVGGAGVGDVRRISRYAASLGLAFQIVDDLLDSPCLSARGERKLTRAARSTEELKPTYPSVVGIAKARSRVAQLQKKCLKEMNAYDEKADPLRAIASFVGERAP